MRELTCESSNLRIPGLRFHESLHLTVREERAHPDWRRRLARNCARAYISDYRWMQPLWQESGEEIPDPQLYLYDSGRCVAGHPETLKRLRSAMASADAAREEPGVRPTAEALPMGFA